MVHHILYLPGILCTSGSSSLGDCHCPGCNQYHAAWVLAGAQLCSETAAVPSQHHHTGYINLVLMWLLFVDSVVGRRTRRWVEVEVSQTTRHDDADLADTATRTAPTMLLLLLLAATRTGNARNRGFSYTHICVCVDICVLCGPLSDENTAFSICRLDVVRGNQSCVVVSLCSWRMVAVVVIGLVFSELARRLAGKIIFKMTYIVSVWV